MSVSPLDTDDDQRAVAPVIFSWRLVATASASLRERKREALAAAERYLFSGPRVHALYTHMYIYASARGCSVVVVLYIRAAGSEVVRAPPAFVFSGGDSGLELEAGVDCHLSIGRATFFLFWRKCNGEQVLL